MARTLEVVRQWELLLALDQAPHGLTLRRLAAIGQCSTRTIRRDLVALETAGFPLYDEKVDGTAKWRLQGKPAEGPRDGPSPDGALRAVLQPRDAGSVRRLPFHADVQRAFARFEKALAPRMKAFLDRLPGVIKAKPARMKLTGKSDPRGERTARLMDATLNRREIRMRYASASSRRVKDYLLHPYRIVYAEGGLYLIAFVPEYGQTRTFALERIRNASVLDTTFQPREPLSPDVFPHSMGVHSGQPEKIVIDFDPAIAAFVRERQWHPSQRLRDRRDGGVTMELNVCRDAALRSWILSFGPSARVTSPASLADEIAQALQTARERYRHLELAPPARAAGPVQRPLPFPADMRKVPTAS